MERCNEIRGTQASPNQTRMPKPDFDESDCQYVGEFCESDYIDFAKRDQYKPVVDTHAALITAM